MHTLGPVRRSKNLRIYLLEVERGRESETIEKKRGEPGNEPAWLLCKKGRGNQKVWEKDDRKNIRE